MMTTNKHRPACNTPTRVPEPRRMSDSMSRPINRKAFYLPSHRHWWKEGNLPLQGGFCKISSLSAECDSCFLLHCQWI